MGRRRDATVSVVIPTVNRCASMRRTLEGLETQTYRPFEVVVVNGPSEDGTAEMLRGFPVRVATVEVINVCTSRNVGVRTAAGDLIAFVDDDAVPSPDWLEQLVVAYDDPAVGAAGGPVFDVPQGRIDWQLCTSTRDGEPNTASEPPASRYLEPGADPFLYLAGCNMSVRRSALREVGGFDERLRTRYEDVEVCARLIDRGHRIAYVETALVDHYLESSLIRDGRQVLTDPYPLVFPRAIFAFQQLGDASRPVLDAWIEDWRFEAGSQHESGLLSAEERDEFVRRAEQGLVDGLAAGARRRRSARLGRARRRAFLPYA